MRLSFARAYVRLKILMSQSYTMTWSSRVSNSSTIIQLVPVVDHRRTSYDPVESVAHSFSPMLRLSSCSRLAALRVIPRHAAVASSLSSGAAPAPNTDKTGGCPFGGEVPSSAKTTKLVKVPMLPYLGSVIPQHSGAPVFDPAKFYDFYPENRRRFGDFYLFGFPGLGKGRDGEMYVLTDPNEMQKVLRQEKGTHPYPRGIVETEWPLIKWLKEQGSPLGLGTDGEADADGFMGRGETWKRLRTFLQTDMLSPQAAKGYIPGMVEAAEFASKGAPASTADLNAYTNRCSFDLFCSLMLGEMTKMADPNTGHDPENIEFCKSAVRGMEAMMMQISNPLQLILFRMGIKTGLYNEMGSNLGKSMKISRKKYEAFRERYEAGDLTEEERNSYLARAIERQAAEGSTISEYELAELIEMSLLAAVDTTSSLLAWNMMHLAINPDVQEKLHAELAENAKASGGRITADTIGKKSPYLQAVIRESHRLTPAVPTTILKENSLSDVEIHGSIIPKDSLFALDSHSVGLDHDFVNDPFEFQPERWLPEAVEARKGTPSEILDHPFYKSPFSQGSRKCPGSRVASNEVLIMISQLVLDWKMRAPADMNNVKDIPYAMSGMIHPKMPELEFEAR